MQPELITSQLIVSDVFLFCGFAILITLLLDFEQQTLEELTKALTWQAIELCSGHERWNAC